jgi:hypothetical protein
LVFIGDTANANMTQGLTINQGAADNEILALKSSDVAHGITATTETDTFGLLKKINGDDGGLDVRGFTEATRGVEILGVGTIGDTARSTAATGYVELGAAKKSGTGLGAPAGNENLVAVRATGLTRFIVDAEGDIHMDATSNQNAWDEYDDIELLTGVRQAMGVSGLAEFVETARDVLEKTGVVTYNPDGHHFISMKGLHGLQIDAMRQLHKRNLELEERLARLEKLL